MRYQFCNDVILVHDNQGYHIIVSGKQTDESNYTTEQIKNPMIAHVRFTNTISEYFYLKIYEYIKSTGRKQGLGCTSSFLNCKACIQAGFNKAENSECYLSPKTAKKILAGDTV